MPVQPSPTDAWGNTLTVLTVEFDQAVVNVGSGSLYGHGSPEGVEKGTFGSLYTNIDDGSFYVKTTKSGNTGWVAVTGSAVSDKMKLTTGDPNGAVTGTRPDIAYDTAGRVWLKTGGGTNNTGWEQLIGPPL